MNRFVKLSTVEEVMASIKVDDLDLSVRSCNCLRRVGINTLSELYLVVANNKLSSVKNLGSKCIAEIEPVVFNTVVELRQEYRKAKAFCQGADIVLK